MGYASSNNPYILSGLWVKPDMINAIYFYILPPSVAGREPRALRSSSMTTKLQIVSMSLRIIVEHWTNV